VSDEPAIVIPAGPSLEEAADWLGHACWCELRLHEVLTAWLAVEADPEAAAALWSRRADAAERAEAWHRRLPELREWPRARFVVPSSDTVARVFHGLDALDGREATEARLGALAAVLRALRLGYHRHAEVAVGPADGPTATTLRAALRGTFEGAGADPDGAWSAAIEEAGGLP
jgi:hypothetical protein